MISFPSDPTLNDTYTAAGRTWKWNGTVWQLQARVVQIADIPSLQSSLDAKIPATEKGAADGVATLDSAGKVPSTQLPSYVDDVIEAATFSALPATGETGKIYVTIDDRKTYRWSGTVYVEISAAPGSTDAVPEGSGNLYYTDARVAAAPAVTALETRAGAIESAATSLEGRVTTAEGSLSTHITATATALDGKQIKTVYSDTAPSHSPGLEWVDTTELRSYRSYGSLWVEIDRA